MAVQNVRRRRAPGGEPDSPHRILARGRPVPSHGNHTADYREEERRRGAAGAEGEPPRGLRPFGLRTHKRRNRDAVSTDAQRDDLGGRAGQPEGSLEGQGNKPAGARFGGGRADREGGGGRRRSRGT